MKILQDQYLKQKSLFRSLDSLSVFVDNHDVKRLFHMLSIQKEQSKPLALSAFTYLYLSYGIPMFYYGTESLFHGGDDPLNREVFDPFKHVLDATMVKYIRVLNEVRRNEKTFDLEPEWRIVENNFLVFTKGANILVAMQNGDNVHVSTFLNRHPFNVGDTLCNVFSDWDCIKVDENKRIKISLVEGYPKVYVK